VILEQQSLRLLEEALGRLEEGLAELPPFEPSVEIEALRPVLLAAADRLRDNFPYPHPLYAGQMLKPPHPIARLAYALAMWINPNNHALDGGRASSQMEKEAVAELARMVGWQSFLGHLTGGGTMANLEALWVAGKLHPGKKIVASRQAHYTHQRLTEVLQLPFESVDSDNLGRLDLAALREILHREEVGTVVATLGTTAAGAVDPLAGLLELQAEYGFRIHADAAYGGYFTLADNLGEPAQAAFSRLSQVDSVVIDPHKHGLQPYGCGCIMFRDQSVGRFYKHDSPYTYFSSAELHLGEISLECSRAGAAAVGLWATQRMFPLIRGGEFARALGAAREAALGLAERIRSDARWMLAFEPELDIVNWAPRAGTASQISSLSREIFNAAADANLHLALASYPVTMFRERWPEVEWDTPQVVCLRSCLMRPEHLTWIETIWEILSRSADKIIGRQGMPLFTLTLIESVL